MTRHTLGPHHDDVDHSHSRIRKLIDDLVSVMAAARSEGQFDRHHDEDVEAFLERLIEGFEGHAHHEEETIFEDAAPRTDDRGREAIEEAIEQHRQLEEVLEAARSAADRLEAGDPSDSEAFGELAENVERIEALWDRHDATEQRIFKGVENAEDAENSEN